MANGHYHTHQRYQKRKPSLSHSCIQLGPHCFAAPNTGKGASNLLVRPLKCAQTQMLEIEQYLTHCAESCVHTKICPDFLSWSLGMHQNKTNHF
jgi:hypothetical protein